MNGYRYQKVIHGVWLLEEAKLLFHISGQIMTIRTLGEPEINLPIAAEVFEIHLPNDTHIRDSSGRRLP